MGIQNVIVIITVIGAVVLLLYSSLFSTGRSSEFGLRIGTDIMPRDSSRLGGSDRHGLLRPETYRRHRMKNLGIDEINKFECSLFSDSTKARYGALSTWNTNSVKILHLISWKSTSFSLSRKHPQDAGHQLPISDTVPTSYLSLTGILSKRLGNEVRP
jgi:hypothetical protein